MATVISLIITFILVPFLMVFGYIADRFMPSSSECANHAGEWMCGGNLAPFLGYGIAIVFIALLVSILFVINKRKSL